MSDSKIKFMKQKIYLLIKMYEKKKCFLSIRVQNRLQFDLKTKIMFYS